MLDLLIGTSCPSLPLGIVEWKNNTLVTVRFEHEIYFALLEKSITKQYQRLHYRYGVRTGRDATQFKMYLFSDLMMIGNVENSLEPDQQNGWSSDSELARRGGATPALCAAPFVWTIINVGLRLTMAIHEKQYSQPKCDFLVRKFLAVKWIMT